jgi:hypothetical protein
MRVGIANRRRDSAVEVYREGEPFARPAIVTVAIEEC